MPEQHPTAELCILSGALRGYSRPVTEQMVVGRDLTCGLQLFDTTVSRLHCQLDWNGTEFELQDLGSRSGTVLNGDPCTAASLYHGDEIQCGKVLLRFDCPALPRQGKTSVVLSETDSVPGLDLLDIDLGKPLASETDISGLLASAPQPEPASPASTPDDPLPRLLNLSRRLSQQPTAEDVLDTLLDGIPELITCHRVVIFFRSSPKQQIRPVRHRGDPTDPPGQRIRVNRKMVDHCLTKNVLCSRRVEDQLWVAAPICGRQGMHGVLYLEPGKESEIEMISAIAADAGTALERSLMATRIQQQNLRLREITDKLRDSEERYRSLFDNSVLGIYRTTPSGQILMVNPALLRILGFQSLEQFKALDLESEFMPTYSREAFKDAIERDGRIIGWESIWQRLDGSRAFLRENAVAVRDAEGNVKYYEGMVEDITERKRVEQDYRGLFEGAHDAILIFSPKTHEVLAVNQRACDLYDLPREKFVGLDLKTITKVTDSSQEWIEKTLAAEQSFHFNMIQFRSDGSEMQLEVNSSVVDYGGERSILAINRDLTARKKLEAQFLESQRMEAMGRLAGGVAHDFNNILTAIQGYAQLTQLRLGDTAESAREMLSEIQRACDWATNVTRQLLAFSRRQVSRPQTTSLNVILQGMEQMMRSLLDDDIMLQFDLDPEIGWLSADVSQLEQVLLNLVINARDAMPSGGTLSIATTQSTSADEQAVVSLQVSDTGVGMDQETRARLFEPFFSTKDPDRGTGLGLSTVYGIVEQHGGQIDVQSQVGCGTVFTIHLPRLAQLDLVPTSGPAPQPMAGQLAKGSGRILLVEDDEHVRAIAASTLKQAGYEVVAAGDGQQALELNSEQKAEFDLLLSDVVMPGLSGPALYERLIAAGWSMPVLFISGHIEDAKGRKLVTGHPFLAKPFSPEELTIKVHELLVSAR